MPNPIKYTTGTETLALKKGNFYIGTGDVGKGPSDVTGFYQGLSPSEGGYVIYMNREGAPGNLSYHVAANDSELISFTNNLAGQSYTTVNECLVYFAGQSDKVCLNRDYEGIVTDGLVLNLDAGFTPSYPRSGTTWYDVGGTNDGTLINGPTFNSDGGGSIVFDGTNDYISFNNTSTFNFGTSDITFSFFIKINNNSINRWHSLYTKRTIGTVDDIRTYVRPESSQNGYLRLYIGNSTSMDVRTDIINNIGYYLIDFILDRDSNWSIYINGQYVGQYSQSPFTDKSNTNISGFASPVFGRQQTSEYAMLNLYTFKIYNRTITPQEVLQNFNAQKGRFGL